MKTKKSLPEPDKEKRKKLLIEMMQEDERNGMYDKSDNELIAEFMGWERYSQNSYKCPNIYPIENSTAYGWTTFTADQLEFATRWDWIMPVVEKIAEYRMAYPVQAMKVCNLKVVIMREALLREVVEFIKWYNSTIKMKNESQKQQCFHYRKGMDEKDCEHSYNTTCECIQQESQEDFVAAFLDWWQQHSWEIEYREQRSFTAREMVEEFKLTRKP